jgi:hypothetical protein
MTMAYSPTQTQQVIALLRERGDRGLTPLDALDLVGSFRLAARISDAKLLIRDDEEIVTERATGPDGKSFARYVLRTRTTSAGEPVQPSLWS